MKIKVKVSQKKKKCMSCRIIIGFIFTFLSFVRPGNRGLQTGGGVPIRDVVS